MNSARNNFILPVGGSFEASPISLSIPAAYCAADGLAFLEFGCGRCEMLSHTRAVVRTPEFSVADPFWSKGGFAESDFPVTAPSAADLVISAGVENMFAPHFACGGSGLWDGIVCSTRVLNLLSDESTGWVIDAGRAVDFVTTVVAGTGRHQSQGHVSGFSGHQRRIPFCGLNAGKRICITNQHFNL